MQSDEVKHLIQIILDAGISAFDKHYKMSGGEWVWNTPEYWYTCQIAEKISKHQPKYAVALENCVADFRECAKPKSGKPSKRLKSGRADITVWKYWKGEDKFTAKTIIEVKRGWYWTPKAMGEDIDRLRAALLQTKGITDVFFVVITDEANKDDESATKRIKNTSAKIKSKIQDHLASKSYSVRVDEYTKFSKHYKEDESRAAVLLYRLRSDQRIAK